MGSQRYIARANSYKLVYAKRNGLSCSSCPLTLVLGVNPRVRAHALCIPFPKTHRFDYIEKELWLVFIPQERGAVK